MRSPRASREPDQRTEREALAQRLARIAWKASPAAYAEAISGGRWKRAPHLQVLSDALVDAAMGRRRRLIVSMPPRHGKSEMASKHAPAWFLEVFPHRRVLLASYEATIAAQFGRAARDLVIDAARLKPDTSRARVRSDVSAADDWGTTQRGGMATAGVGGPLTGKGADLLIIDDPIKNAEEAASPTMREKVWNWWKTTARTRLEPGSAAVVVMTRWHEDDLAGRLLEQAKEGGDQWDVIGFPAIAEGNDVLGRSEGEALWPERYSAEDFAQTKITVGPMVWASLYQQRPAALEGALFKREWWRTWRELPAKFDRVIQSWDLAFKGGQRNDFVVGQVWGLRSGEAFLLDQVRGRMAFPATLEAVKALSAKWPRATTKLVEDKANGPALIDTLRDKVPGLVPVEPAGDKVARASAISGFVEAGNVYLPEPSPDRPWVGDLVAELASFPSGANDDQVDALSQALHRLFVTDRFDRHAALYAP